MRKESRGLSKQAYSPVPEGQQYTSYVPPAESPAEFTLKAIVAGIIFGILFGAANAYLGLRAGLTISTSIPIAVMTVAGFRILQAMGVKNTILESNISQTSGSASSSLASGVIFTLPALFLWEMDPTLVQMTLLAIFGGILGTLFMVPLRRFLIVREHGRLPYPEGTACAEVLVASEAGGSQARNVFLGLGAGALFKFLSDWLKLFPDVIQMRIPFLRKAQIGMELSAALFGVGYILGPRIGAIMVGGGLLSSLIIIPAIAYWGEARTVPLFPEMTKTIAEMSASEIWNRYVRYIGAGAVATAGLITLIRSIPTMLESFRIGAKQMKAELGQKGIEMLRTDRDLPLPRIIGGALVVIVVMAIVPHVFATLQSFGGRLLAALLVGIFAFFFATVSSRIVGFVGVTSNPTSGMTIASLLGTATVFLLMGWTDDFGKAAAITIGCVVAVAASIAGDTSQDLKTGFLLGATPSRQQLAQMIGVLTSAAFVCMAVLLLDRTYGFGTTELPAPQATLMKLVIEGVLQSELPWGLVGIGVLITIIMEVLRIPSLPFAVGVYLPVTTMVPVFLGGMLRKVMEKRATTPEAVESRREQGVLFGSGLVGGEGLMGVGIAAAAFIQGAAPAGIGDAWAGAAAPFVGLAMFGLLAFLFIRAIQRRS